MVMWLLWVLLALPGWAMEVQLRATPDELAVGQSGMVELFFVFDGRTARPKLNRPPELAAEGLSFRYRGQSSSYANSNGRIVQIVGYQYALDALTTGVHTVPPVDVTLSDGSVVSSNALQITVAERPESMGAGQIVVEAGFGESTAWEGEVLMYTYKLQVRELGAMGDWRLPAFDGLRLLVHGDPQLRRYELSDPDGDYTVEEGYVPLLATGTGSRDQPPAVVSVRIPDGRRNLLGFRSMKVERRASEPSALTVRPLPAAPPGFTGVVGDFEVQSVVDKRRAAVGESINWRVRLQGSGTLEGFSLPQVRAEGMSIYEGENVTRGRVVEEGYEGVAIFDRVLVPTEPGELEIPPLEIVVFSPTEGRYSTLKVAVPTLQISAGREGSGEIESFASAGDEEATPLEPIELRDVWTWGPASTVRVASALPLLLVGFGAPGLLVQLAWGVGRAREARARRLEARRGPPSPRAHLAPREASMERQLSGWDVAVRQALANREGVSLGALRRAEAIARLPAAQRDEAVAVTRELDRARFAGKPSAELEARVLSLLEAL